jgi:DivIVA domain-containing protein
VSIYVTDARFVNELDAIKAIGGYIARLDVSTDVQAERIMGRDGTAVTDSMRNHISETAADHYDKFDIVLDTDHETPDELAKSIIEDMDRRSRVTGLPDFVDSVGGRYQFFTPKEVNDIEFPITTIMESYDSGEVDAYLAIIADVITDYENGRGREAKARLTANEVRDKELPSRRFRKGYDAESVDEFLNQLAFTLSMYERYYDGLDDSATQSLTPDEQHELSKRIHELDAQS